MAQNSFRAGCCINKWESINERGLTSSQWAVCNEGTKRTTYSAVPTSDTTAEAVAVDGFTISQTDNAGITTTSTCHYSPDGMTLTQNDERGNAATSITDKAGRTVSQTDAAGHITTTVYDAAHDQPSVITGAMGDTCGGAYDERGRLRAGWSTGIRAICFACDDNTRPAPQSLSHADTKPVNDAPGN